MKNWLPLGAALFALCNGCATHFHDDGRMKVSKEAVEIAAEIQGSGFGVFGVMEKNLDAAVRVRRGVDAVLDESVAMTFTSALATLSSEEIATEVELAVLAHAEAGDAIESAVDDAVKGVNESLDAQAVIANAIREEKGTGLTDTVARIDSRVDWILGKAKYFRKAAEALNAGDLKGEEAQQLLGSVSAVLGSPADDEETREASALLAEAAQAAVVGETQRLTELRRFLTELRALQDSYGQRHELWAEIFPAILPLIPPLRLAALHKMGGFEDLGCRPPAPDGEDGPRVAGGRDDPDCIPFEDTEALYAADWKGRAPPDRSTPMTLTEFATVSLAADRSAEMRESAMAAIGALGVLVLVETPIALRTAVAADTARHRHSIRLSAVNADQRLGLIVQLAQGLEIYHKGGIKPEEVAQLVLMAGQVGALAFIGAGQ